MTKQSHLKQERVIEAVRLGFEGEDAIEFLHQSGYAMTSSGISRHLRKLGGRGRVQELLEEGFSNVEVLETCLPDEDLSEVKKSVQSQGDLFGDFALLADKDTSDVPLYATTKISLNMPSELYEAIRAAAQAERKSQNQMIIDLLAAALARQPQPTQQEFEHG